MRKNAWVICCCTAVLAAFGTFFRWLQDQVCFEAETGLAVRGSIWPYAVALMIVIAAVVLAVVCFRMKNQPHTYFPDSLPAALAASPRVRTIGGIVLGALLAVGGLWLLLGSGTHPRSTIARVMQTGKSEYNISLESIKHVSVISDRMPLWRDGEIEGAIAIFRNRTEVTRLAQDLTGVQSAT